MLRYVLHILAFLFCVLVAVLWTLWSFIFGDIREAWSDLKRDIPATKMGFINVMRGESFF